MGHRDADGWFFFDYRKGGSIRHNGDFINTGFVEKADRRASIGVRRLRLRRAGGLRRAGREGRRRGNRLGARRAAFDPAAIFAACRKGLEPNFVPTYLQVVDEIPKTASEKPQERFLLERFAPDAPGVFTE